MSTFNQALATNIPEDEIAKHSGKSYLAAATALIRAGLCDFKFVDFAGESYLPMFGGGVVAVDLPLPPNPETGEVVFQRTWLAIYDSNNRSISEPHITSVEVNNARQRCLVKAIAMTYGHGLSLFAGKGGNGEGYAKALGLKDGVSLLNVEPKIAMLKENNVPFVEWHAALAAARSTDPVFSWEVLMFPGEDGRMVPYRALKGNSVEVGVSVTHLGKTRTIFLPITCPGPAPEYRRRSVALKDVDTEDWNNVVMRTLAKAIAFTTGYGLRVYSEELRAELVSDKPLVKADAAAKADAPVETNVNAKAEVKAEVKPAVSTPEKAAEAEAVAEPAANAAAEVAQQAVPESTPEAKADEPATPAVTETPASTVDAAAPVKQAPALTEEFRQELDIARDRFKKVIGQQHEREDVKGVLGLFERLSASDKYAEEHKPYLFRTLIQASYTLVCDKPQFLNDFLAELKKYDGIEKMAPESKKALRQGLCYLSFVNGDKISETEATNRGVQLVKAGVASTLEEAIDLAEAGGLANAVVALLRDMAALPSDIPF